MPFIHIRAYSGREDAVKKDAAQAVMKAASQAMNTPESAFTVVFEDVEKADWEKDVLPTIESLKDKMFIDHGEAL